MSGGNTHSIRFVNSQEFEQVLAHNKYVVANFTASWCGPCQAIKPLVDSIYEDKAFHKVEIVRIDLDTQRALAERYQVTAVPTFVFMVGGQTVEVVKGATLKIKDAFESLRQKAEDDKEAGDRWVPEGVSLEVAGASAGSAASNTAEVDQLIPQGFRIVPVAREVEALNVEYEGDIKDVLDINKPGSIHSDADSQMLLYLPLPNISKIYSILIKFASKNNDSTNDDEDRQYANQIKVWINKPGILSFDDIENVATHHETIDSSNIDANGWYECKLKYVRFQNVQSLNIFFDGEDEDSQTIIDKLVLVGLTGEEKVHSIVDKLTLGEEEA